MIPFPSYAVFYRQSIPQGSRLVKFFLPKTVPEYRRCRQKDQKRRGASAANGQKKEALLPCVHGAKENGTPCARVATLGLQHRHTPSHLPADPLGKEVYSWMNKEDVYTVPWVFSVFPGQSFKNDVGAGLLQYAQGTKTWEDVKTVFVNRWKEEMR